LEENMQKEGEEKEKEKEEEFTMQSRK